MIPIPGTFTLQVTAIVGAIALVVGMGAGGYAVHSWYSPRLALEKERVKTLGEKIDEQNKAITKLEDAGKKQKAAAAAAIAAARGVAATAEADAQNLLMMQPPPGVDRCTAASGLIRSELAK